MVIRNVPLRSAVSGILGVLLVIVLAEVVTRTWIQSPNTEVLDSRHRLVHFPHARVVQSREGWAVSRANSLGLLDDEPRTPRPPLRVLLLGDSFTEALQVARRDNFQSVAERAVPGLEVVSVGRPGGCPVDYLDWATDHWAALRPDLLVLQVEERDLLDILTPEALARQEEVRRDPAAATLLPPPPPPRGLLKRIFHGALRHSALALMLYQRLVLRAEAQAATSAGFTTTAHDPRQARLMDDLQRRFAALAPRMLYLYIPNLGYAQPGCPDLDPGATAFFHAFARRNRVPLVDPTGALRAEFLRTGRPLHGFPNTVLGVGHLNAAGHRVVGTALARAIVGVTR